MNYIRQLIIMIEHIIASILIKRRGDDEISSSASIQPVATTSGLPRHIAVIAKILKKLYR